MYVLFLYQTEWGVMKNPRYVGPFDNLEEANDYASGTSGWRWAVHELMSIQEFEGENAQ